jgi:Ca2+-binding EF-hand superfamily protein
MYVPEQEAIALIDRYDRTRDGGIYYDEFLAELTAKSI